MKMSLLCVEIDLQIVDLKYVGKFILGFIYLYEMKNILVVKVVKICL